MPLLLVIDDDRTVLHMVSRAFKEDDDIEVLTAQTAEDGLAAVKQRRPDVVLHDIVLPQASGLQSFRQIHETDPKLPVVFITSRDDSETAIEAMMLGAYDYLVKPLDLERVREIVRQAIETRQIMDAPVEVTIEGSRKPDADLLIGRSAGVLNVYKQIGRVARQDVTVLIRGESGTGKELVARAIYQHSRRAGKPFLAVNCAALTDSLLESELFGHEKGSFTGADQRRIGKFEQCHGGTIFLDEVGDMSAVLQSKVLRVLQEQKFERVGGNKTIETDVRVIAATNRDLEKMVIQGSFRSDLYYRLNGVTIELPPLRQRDGDVMLLVEHFIARFRGEMGKEQVQGVAPKTVELLRSYSWPGNIRELQSVVRQALMNSTGPVLVPEFLPEEVRQGHRTRPAAPSPSGPLRDPKSDLQGFVERQLASDSDNLYADALELMERYVLTRVLEKTDGNQSQAAKILGITRGSLRNKIRSLGISIGQVISVGGDDSEEE